MGCYSYSFRCECGGLVGGQGVVLYPCTKIKLLSQECDSCDRTYTVELDVKTEDKKDGR